VADGMMGGNHRSNTELIGQGVANVFSSLFGGIPATGAIARTATNIKNGGRTPVAGMVHAVTLLLIMLFVGRWASLIPMATLAGILVVVAYNMSEWESFLSVLKGPRGDIAVLLTTFLLTILVDLTVAIEIGMLMAAVLFVQKMIRSSDVSIITAQLRDDNGNDGETGVNDPIPKGVEVFEISGPLFFGATHKFKEAIRIIEKPPLVLIVRMRQVPIIDASGLRTLEDVHRECLHRGTRLIISEVKSKQVMQELTDTGLLAAIGGGNVTSTFNEALQQCREILLITKE
jgi:SulP family sulfate permease